MLTAVKSGLNGKDCVKISGGSFVIDAGSDGIRSDNEAGMYISREAALI